VYVQTTLRAVRVKKSHQVPKTPYFLNSDSEQEDKSDQQTVDFIAVIWVWWGGRRADISGRVTTV
jgi:hypothetical protein